MSLHVWVSIALPMKQDDNRTPQGRGVGLEMCERGGTDGTVSYWSAELLSRVLETPASPFF